MPKAVTIRKVDGKPGQVYYPYAPLSLPLSTIPPPSSPFSKPPTNPNHYPSPVSK